MSRAYTQIDTTTDTFYNWVVKTNDMLAAFGDTITVSADATGNSTTGNATLLGIFVANSIVAGDSLRGGTLSTPAAITITTNSVFSGARVNSTANTYLVAANVYTVSNTFVVGSNTSVNAISVLGNSTATAVALNSNNVTISGNVTVSNSATFSAPVTTTNTLSVASITVNTTLMTTSNATLAGTSDAIIDSWSGSTYRGGKYVYSAKDDAGNATYQIGEVIIMNDGTNALITEYAVLRSNGTLMTLSANVDGTTVRLWANSTVANSSIKFQKTLFAV